MNQRFLIAVALLTALPVFNFIANRKAQSERNTACYSQIDSVQRPPADKPLAGKDTTRHTAKVKAVRQAKYEVALIGNSIIHTLGEFGGKYKPLEKTWKKYFVPRKAINLGYSGYRTENILWNLENGELNFLASPKLFILLIGTNNADDRHFPTVHTAEEIFKGTEAIVKLIHKKHPLSKILILRIFPRGGDTESGEGSGIFHASEQCVATCRRAGELTKKLADNIKIFWVDAGNVFLLPGGKINTKLMPDLLHPNEAGARAWVKAIEPTVAKLLGTKTIK